MSLVIAVVLLAGGWSYMESKDPMTDVPMQTLLLQSQEGSAWVVLGCHGPNASLTVSWERFIRLERASILHRIDSAPAVDLTWKMSEDGLTGTHPESGGPGLKAFVAEMAGGSKLLLRADAHGGSYAMATFKTGGLAEMLPRLKACLQ